MSVQALSWVLDHSKEKYGKRLILIALANHASERQFPFTAWPSVGTIAREAHLGERMVQKALREMEEEGVVKRVGVSQYGTYVYEFGGAISAGVPSSTPDPSTAATPSTLPLLGLGATHDTPVPSSTPLTTEQQETYRILCDVAAKKAAKPPKVESILAAINDYPALDCLKVAKDLRFWLTHGKGANVEASNVAGRYRNFLKEEEKRRAANAPKPDLTEERMARARAAMAKLEGQ